MIKQVHRCYLASCSQYFNSMFTQGFKENAEKEITMHGLTAEGLGAILHYMYTGVIKITHDRISDILQAASMLQIVDVLEFCSQYLKDYLTVENTLEFYKVADLYALHEASEGIIAHMLENYSSLFQTQSFLNECNFDLLCKLLESDSLHVDSELIVFQSVVKWLKQGLHRQDLAVKVLKLVRFGLMNSTEMELVKAEAISQQPECAELLQKSIEYHLLQYKQPVIDAYFARPRSVPSLVVLVAGYSTNTMLASPIKQGELAALTLLEPIEPVKILNDSVTVVVNNFLFIVGGTTYQKCHKVAFRYNPTNKEWLELASMEWPHRNFVLLSLPYCLVAVGGVIEEDMDASVEKYSIEENTWSRLPPLETDVCFHAGCTHGGCMYITGGSDHESGYCGASNRVHCYDPAQGEWIQKCPLNYGRSAHMMGSHGEKMYVCGGMGGWKSCRDVLETEMYDAKTNQWSVVTPMPFLPYAAVATCCGNNLFVVGGETASNEHDDDECEASTMLRFDMDTLDWAVLMLKLRIPKDVVVNVLNIPRQMYN